MRKLVIATGNPGKVREIKAILHDSYDAVVSMREEGIKIDIIEDADSFLGNAAKKALAVSLCTKWDVVADDSGLCVEGLGGRPGVYSARYSAGGTDKGNNQKLVEEVSLLEEQQRKAYYACAIVLARQGKKVFQCEGRCYGQIILQPRGTQGFGYDPYFYLPAYKKTFGELDPAIKNKISHRAVALEEFRHFAEGETASKKV